jgi:hypothetical protein
VFWRGLNFHQEKNMAKYAGMDHSGHLIPDTCECGEALPLQVLKSAAGYYLGRACPSHGPHSRTSKYFATPEEAEPHIDFLNRNDAHVIEVIGLKDAEYEPGLAVGQ